MTKIREEIKIKRNAVVQQKGDEKWIIGFQLYGYRMGRRIRV